MLVFFANLGNLSSDIWPYFFFLSNEWLRAVLDGKSSQEHPVSVIISLLLVLHLVLMTVLMILYVILLSMLMILLSTLNVIRYLIYGSN